MTAGDALILLQYRKKKNYLTDPPKKLQRVYTIHHVPMRPLSGTYIQNKRIFKEFLIKIFFFEKKIYEISFEIKLLSKIMYLDHIERYLVNAIVLNSGFTIFEFNYHCCG